MQPQLNDRVIRRHDPARSEQYDLGIETPVDIMRQLVGRQVTYQQALAIRRILEPRPSIFPPRRLQRSPDRMRSRLRAREKAKLSPIPARLACLFTQKEQAVLCIIAEETLRRGDCRLHIDTIATFAGCGRTTVQNALRWAERLRLLTITERKRPGQKNDTNIVRIVSKEWLAWLQRGPRVGFKRVNPTQEISDPSSCFVRGEGPEKGTCEVEFARSVPRSPP